MTVPDTLTVIRSPFMLLAKRIHASGRIDPYGSAKTIDLFEQPVSDLTALQELIARLLPKPRCAVVYGGIADPERVRHVRRLSKADLKTGDLPTIRPVQHQWCALDLDGVERPLDVPAHDLAACAAHAVRRLPAAFKDARCIVQASASHGIKPGCRLRLWYWLDRPVTGDEMKLWLKPYPVDTCTFVTAQPIYTAAPVFIGRSDHLPSRVAEAPGTEMVAVPAPELLRPPEKPRPSLRAEAMEQVSQERVQQIIDDALRRVRNAPSDGKHYALRDNARLLGGIAAEAGVSDAWLIDRLVEALPSGVEDWGRAQATAEWGLAIGREEPIKIPVEAKSLTPDPRRQETARTAFRLLRAGIAGEDIIAALDEQNDERDAPCRPMKSATPCAGRPRAFGAAPMRDDAGLAAELDAIRGGDTVKVPAGVAPTEDAVARAFAETNAGKFVYDHTAEEWFIWTGRWTRDLRSAVFHAARVFCRAVRATISDPPYGMAKIAFAAAVERAARADPKLAVSHEIWDRDPWLLGTPDGVVDLRTGLQRPATPDLYISRYASVTPSDPGTEAKLWSAFLDAATNHDKELQGFLSRFCGYTLTGDVTEEVVTFLYGPGGNGKGVFLAALTGILGDYAVSVPIEVFTANTRINLEYYRAQMAGARLITASETEAQATWAESQIKEMTGNETPLSARNPYGRPFTYRPRFKITLVGNHAPKLKGRSAAMERRLRVIPFNHTPTNPDPDLKDKLKSEYPVILRQMIDGCLAWQHDRLGAAKAISAATTAYFEQQDVFRRWMDECCKLDPSLSLKPGLLLENFNAWARGNGEEMVSGNTFAELIDRTAGLRRVKKNGTRVVEGIGLNPHPHRDSRDD